MSTYFTASGLVVGDPGQTRISEIVLDNQRNPVPNVTLRVGGTSRQAVSDDAGQFIITEAPVGPVHRIADGWTATVEAEFPSLSFNLVTVSEVENPLAVPIYMVKLNVYDERGRVEAVVDPVAGAFHFEYDAASRPITQSAPTGAVRSVTYTDEGYIAQVQLSDATGVLDTIGYSGHDELGNPGFIDSGEGQTAVSYDTLNRVKTVAYPDATTESFRYDRVGNRIGHIDRSGADRSYAIDGADQLTAIVDTATQAVLESFAYDGAGRRIQRQVTGGETTSYGYDGNGRLTSMSRSDGFAMTLGYDPTGRLYRRADAGGVAFYLGRGVLPGEWPRVPLRAEGALDSGSVGGGDRRAVRHDAAGADARWQRERVAGAAGRRTGLRAALRGVRGGAQPGGHPDDGAGVCGSWAGGAQRALADGRAPL